MRLDLKAMALTVGLAWGVLVMFLTGVANLLWDGLGTDLLDVMASLYPGHDAAASFGQVMIGTLYGVLDGAICGLAIAWLYNRLATQ